MARDKVGFAGGKTGVAMGEKKVGAIPTNADEGKAERKRVCVCGWRDRK